MAAQATAWHPDLAARSSSAEAARQAFLSMRPVLGPQQIFGRSTLELNGTKRHCRVAYAYQHASRGNAAVSASNELLGTTGSCPAPNKALDP